MNEIMKMAISKCNVTHRYFKDLYNFGVGKMT